MIVLRWKWLGSTRAFVRCEPALDELLALGNADATPLGYEGAEAARQVGRFDGHLLGCD
jgi:hypothetical protein